jgi:uncharacterized coiled-coil DUF342 family protein
MQREKYPELSDQFDFLREEKTKLEAVVNPLRERRDELQAKMQPLVEEDRDLIAQIKEHMPRMAEIDNQIGALARAMGARVAGHSGE